jgi:hypothetical protein
MYSLEDIARAITIWHDARDMVTFEHVASMMYDIEREEFINILSDLYLIREKFKPIPWYEPGPTWNKEREMMWVWVEDEPEN